MNSIDRASLKVTSFRKMKAFFPILVISGFLVSVSLSSPVAGFELESRAPNPLKVSYLYHCRCVPTNYFP
jgi:hypothetical protein